jgi:multidrug resistance protein, MATE family
MKSSPRSSHATSLGQEARAVGTHTATIFAGQLAVMAFGIVDTVVAGRYSTQALAALSVGASIYISVYVSLLGVAQALLPIYAEHRGAGRLPAVGAAARQAFYLSLALALVGVSALAFPGPLLRWAEVPSSMLGDVRQYLWVIAAAFVPALWFRMYASLSQALGKPWLVTSIQLLGLVLKVPLSVLLTFGWGPVPELGVVGCAWATLVVNLMMLFAAIALLRHSDAFAAIALWKKLEKPNWPELRSFLRLGLPSGIATMIEVTSFTLMALFVARLGSTASAGHQIASNLAALLFMLPLSMGFAGSARASWHLGAGAPQQAVRTILASFGLLAGVSISLVAIIFIANENIAALYSKDTGVIALAAQLLPWVCLFHLMDATQALASSFLRCYRITVLPVLLYAVSLWGVGLGGGYMLTYQGFSVGAWQWPAVQSPQGFWIAGAVANAVVALSSCALLRLHARWRVRAPNARAGAVL